MISLVVNLVRLPDFRGYARRVSDLRKPMHMIGLAMVSSTKRRIRDGHSPAGEAWKTLNPITAQVKGSAKPLLDTGRLRASIRSELVSPTAVMIGTNLIYGRIHQEGGTILPRRAKLLAIPLRREFKAKPARKQRGLFVIRSRRGNLLLVKRDGAGIKPCYLLLERVKIPARPYLGVSDADKATIQRILAEHFLPGGA
jgi:phage virion morphogenesis protein